MSEIRTIFDQEIITYSGVINPKELFETINKWFVDKSYVPIEIESFEKDTDHGKEITVITRPFRRTSDYVKSIFEIEYQLSNLTNVEIVKNDQRIKLKKGNIQIIMAAFLETDYENNWETRPAQMIIRTLYDKLFFRSHIEKFETTIKADADHLKAVIKSYLNLNRYQ